MLKEDYYINKEISWLSFNERVLQEAADKSVPLIERIKFLGIFSSNLDEFFRVRVATLKRISNLGKKATKIIGDDPDIILKEIQKIVLRQHKRFDKTYQQILKDLAEENIFIIDEKKLNDIQGEYVKSNFLQEVRPKLFPIMIDQILKFPELRDQSIYLIVRLIHSSETQETTNALIEVPTDLISRFLVLPKYEGNRYIILLDDIIRYGLVDVFANFNFDRLEAYTIKITRDAELDIDDDVSQSYIKKVSKSLKQRKEGPPVRFIYDSNIPKDLLHVLRKKMKLSKGDALIPGVKYHNFKDFMNFPDLGLKHLKYKPFEFLVHPDLNPEKSLFNVISEKDILLHYPYQSFHHVIDLLREASIDPNVKSIKITLYRVAKNSAVVNALINAIKNGKTVTAVMELQARFDEEANIYWANRLQEEGARVIFGVPGLKVHSKLCLIIRKEGKKITRYAIIGTGNFNEDTARIYSDHSLFTADEKLTLEIENIFDFFDNNYKISKFKHLIVSPFQMRKKITHLIKKEIFNAQNGKEAYIIFKLNNLVDPKIIEKFYKASQAGVDVKLNVRGMFSLVPNIPDLSNNIQAVSIVDRFLEHTRIFVFCNGGDELYFISSGDLMQRNLDRRIEVTCPIYNKAIQDELRNFLDIQWKDNIKARIRNDKLIQTKRKNSSKNKFYAQKEIYEYLKTIHSVSEKEKII